MQTKQLADAPVSGGETLKRVKRAIDQRGYSAIRKLQFKNDQGVVSVRGRLPSYYMCQVALACIKSVPGVVRIVNLIDVVYDPIRPRVSDHGARESKPRPLTRVDSEVYNDNAGVMTCGKIPCQAGATIND